MPRENRNRKACMDALEEVKDHFPPDVWQCIAKLMDTGISGPESLAVRRAVGWVLPIVCPLPWYQFEQHIRSGDLLVLSHDIAVETVRFLRKKIIEE